MDEKIVEMIVSLVRDGGTAAIWVFAIHYGISIAKFAIGFGFFYGAVCKVCSVIKGVCDAVHEDSSS